MLSVIEREMPTRVTHDYVEEFGEAFVTQTNLRRINARFESSKHHQGLTVHDTCLDVETNRIMNNYKGIIDWYVGYGASTIGII